MTALGFLGGFLGALLVIAAHHALARRLDSHKRIARRLRASHPHKITVTSAKPISSPASAIKTRVMAAS